MAETIRKRINQRLAELQLTPNAASEKAGLDRSVLRKFLNRTVRELRDSNLQAIAAALDVSPAWLRGHTEETGTATGMGKHDVPVVGIVEARSLRPRDYFDSVDLGVVQNGFDPNFPSHTQTAYLVRGNHADLAGILDGFVVICIDPWESEGALSNGELVVVERLSNGGTTAELTVREFRILPDHYELRCLSRDPKHEPIRLGRDADIYAGDVRVLGIVTSIIHRLPVKVATAVAVPQGAKRPGSTTKRRSSEMVKQLMLAATLGSLYEAWDGAVILAHRLGDTGAMFMG